MIKIFRIVTTVWLLLRASIIIIAAYIQSIDLGHAAWLFIGGYPETVLIDYFQFASVVHDFLFHKLSYTMAVLVFGLFVLLFDFVIIVMVYSLVKFLLKMARSSRKVA